MQPRSAHYWIRHWHYPAVSLGGLLLLAAGIGLILSLSRTNQTQDNRSQASEKDKVVVSTVAPTTITTGNRFNSQFLINTHNHPIDGVQLVFTLTGVKTQPISQQNITNIHPKLKLAHLETQATNNGYKVGLILVTKDPLTSYTNQTDEEIFRLNLTPTNSGTLKLQFDPTQSIASNWQQPELNLLEPIPVIQANISQASAANNLLTLKFQLKGVKAKEAQVPTTIEFVTNHQETQSIRLTRLFQSDQQGVFINQTSIDLDQLDLNPQTSYTIKLKTPISLRKTVGRLSFDNGYWLFQPKEQLPVLLVGDFVTSPQLEWNKINLKDIAAITSRFNQLIQSANTPSLKPFDVNFDGYLDIQDITIALASYYQLEIEGD